jgi:hypothetical protein
MTEYIYLLQTREFINKDEKIYKIGRTCKDNLTRFNQYPKGSKLLFQVICEESKEREKELLIKFREKYIEKKEIGNEYFEGNYNEMIKDIFECIEKEYIQLKKEKDKKERMECYSCGGSGTSYWSDDCYGSCFECCCINCGEFNEECQCKCCEKCETSYMKDEEHKCYLCEKCGKYEKYESRLKEHCKECCNCGKITYTGFLRNNGKCGPCYDGSKI